MTRGTADEFLPKFEKSGIRLNQALLPCLIILNMGIELVMGIEEFDLLVTTDKKEALWLFGILIKNNINGFYNCDVYKLYQFYVGVYYKRSKYKKVVIVSMVVKRSISGGK